MSIKRITEYIKIWVEENKAIIVALLMLLLCFGLLDKVVRVIDKSLLLVTNIARDPWLDWLFIILTISLGIAIWRNWIMNKRIVAPRMVGLILVPLVLYAFFRFAPNSPYTFASYWDGHVSYLDGFAIEGFVIVALFVLQQFKNTREKFKDDIYSFDPDAPIDSFENDLFNMDNLINRIVNYIAFTDVRDAAFSMGIVGEWGDGKTSLMNLVEERIRKEHEDFIIVHFNPRASKKADFIQEDFLESLKQALLSKHSGIDRTIDKYAIALDAIPGIPSLVSKSLELLHIRSDKEREVKRGELKKAILDINNRIVVMVDDLDRLTGEELIEVLKVLDTNGAFPNMVFLTSFDKDYVNTILKNYLRLGDHPRTYTDKYFTVEIRVPLHPTFRLMDYLVTLLKNAATKGFITQMDAVGVEEQTRSLSSSLLPRLRTIRDIKRFANQFLYDYAEVQKDVSYKDFMLLELIKFAHYEDYKAIYTLKYVHRGQSSFLSPSSDELFYLNDKLLPKKSKAGDSFIEPEIKPDSIDILRNLFPEESSYKNWYQGRYHRIYSASSFETYFYNYEYSHLKTDDTDLLFKSDDIFEIFKLIDSWGDFTKDLETYLLTRDINSIKSKRVLRRYMQLLLYAAHKHHNLNYLGHNYSFLRKTDVNRLKHNCDFTSTEEYINWFKESMAGLTVIDPIIPSNFIRTPISSMFSDNADPDLFVMSLHDMQEYAIELLNNYLKQAGTEGWDVSKSYFMAQIENDGKGTFLPAASMALHDAIVTHFDLFAPTLPFYEDDFSGVMVGFNPSLQFKSVFVDLHEFEALINAEEHGEDPEIDMIRAIWPIYKANECHNFVLPKGSSIEEAKATKLKYASDQLSRFKVINKQMDDLSEEWEKAPRLNNVEAFISRAKGILEELSDISLELRIKEKYEIQLNDMINRFQEYARTARNFTSENLRVGDFVRMKRPVFEKNLKEHSENLIYKDNIFTIGSISGNGQVMTRESALPLSLNDIEAILIDGVEDVAIYYKSKHVMATYVAPGKTVEPHRTDYSYYMEHFKRYYDVNEKSYYDWIIESGFQFVHEVQHWLKDTMRDEGLEIHHSIREDLRITLPSRKDE